jgi:hypothetical protein
MGISIARTAAAAGLLVAIVGGGYYAVHHFGNGNSAKVEQDTMSLADRVKKEMDTMKAGTPEKYQLTKQYILDDIANNPYQNKDELGYLVNTAISADQKGTLKIIGKFYSNEIKDMLNLN